MSLTMNRFKKIVPEYSILSDDAQEQRDKQKPFNLSEWITNSNIPQGNPEQYIASYNKYLNDWATKSNVLDKKDDIIIKMYEDIVKQIGLNYTTSEERRFLANLDYTKPTEIDAAIPFYATRLKEIVLYISKQRNVAKSQRSKYNQFGTKEGAKNLIKNTILNNIDPASAVNVDKTLKINVEELYDTYDAYFNQEPCCDVLETNSVEYDPFIFVDFSVAVKNVASDVAGVILADTTGIGISNESGLLLSITLDTNSIDYNQFPPDQFFNFINSEENLNLYNQQKFVQNYIGSKLISLSADTKGNYLTADHVEPTNPLYNFYNKRYPTINYTAKTTNLFTARQLGGYCTPLNLSTINYISVGHTVKIDTTKLTAGVYELPDPSRYGSEPFVVHTENVDWLKASNANGALAGSIINDTQLNKFYGYQSKVETNKFSQYGISRVEDNFDFWSGDESSVWVNSDVYELPEQNAFDLDTRQEDLLLSHYSDGINIHNRGIISKWNNDIFGNNISLFKKNKPAKLGSESVWAPEDSEEYVTPSFKCEYIYGGTFLDKKGNDQASSIEINGGDLDSFSSDSPVIIDGYIFLPDLCPDIFSETLDSLQSNFNLSIPYHETNIREDYSTSLLLPGINGVSSSNNLTKPLTIHKQRYETTGTSYVRNINHTIIDELTAGMKGTFDKYPEDIKAELNQIIDIDIIYDYMLIQTPTYKIIDKIDYDYDENKFIPTNTLFTISAGDTIASTDKFTDKFTTHFFNEEDNTITFGKIVNTTQGANYYSIPQLYKLNLDDGKVTMVYDGSSSETEKDKYKLGTVECMGISQPLLTYNEILDQFVITFVAQMEVDMDNKYPAIIKIVLNNEHKKLTFISAEKFESLVNDAYESPYNSEQVELNNITIDPDTNTGEYDIRAINTMAFDLIIDPEKTPKINNNYEIIKLIYDWGGDSTDTETVDAALVAPAEVKNNPAGSPLNIVKRKHFKFSGPGDTKNISISAIDYNMNQNVYKINIELAQDDVGNIQNVLGELNLIESKSFVNNKTEYTLLVVEPTRGDIFQILLKGKTYE